MDLIKELVMLLEESKNERTQSVACFDIGEFAKYVPFGRSILDKWNVKEKIYELLKRSKNADVRKEAITCLQKLVVISLNE